MTRSPRSLVALMLGCTTVISAAIVLRPAPVDAAFGSASYIVDYATGKKTRVTNEGRLLTQLCDADSCASTVSGRMLVSDGSGAMTVDGVVGAQPRTPATPWNQINDIVMDASNTLEPLYTGFGTTKLALTSMTLSATADSAGKVGVLIIVYVSNLSTGDCDDLTSASFGAAERFYVNVPVDETVHLTWPTPLVYTAFGIAGRRYCVDAQISAAGPANYAVHLAASGFIA